MKRFLEDFKPIISRLFLICLVCGPFTIIFRYLGWRVVFYTFGIISIISAILLCVILVIDFIRELREEKWKL